MLEVIQLMFRGNIVYKMVIMKNCFHGNYFKRYLPIKPGIFIFFHFFFKAGIHALEILDTQLLLNYTMIGHGV